MFWQELQSSLPTAAVTSPGLFKEWVSAETPGRLPLGPVVVLGQLSGRPVGPVCVCIHLYFRRRPIRQQCRWAGFNIFSTLSKLRYLCLNVGLRSDMEQPRCWWVSVFESFIVYQLLQFLVEHQLGGLLLKEVSNSSSLVLILLVTLLLFNHLLLFFPPVLLLSPHISLFEMFLPLYPFSPSQKIPSHRVLSCALSIPLFLWSFVDVPGFRRSLLHHCPLVVFSPL